MRIFVSPSIGEQFKPEVNYVTNDFIEASITGENLLRFNLGWVATLAWLCFTIILGYVFIFSRKTECYYCDKYGICRKCYCCTCHDADDIPLLLRRDALFVSKDDLERDTRSKYRSIKEARLIKDDILKHRPYCTKLWHLFRISLRNDHLWWGICCRNSGSSYGSTKRVAVMAVRLLTTMAVSGTCISSRFCCFLVFSFCLFCFL